MTDKERLEEIKEAYRLKYEQAKAQLQDEIVAEWRRLNDYN